MDPNPFADVVFSDDVPFAIAHVAVDLTAPVDRLPVVIVARIFAHLPVATRRPLAARSRTERMAAP